MTTVTRPRRTWLGAKLALFGPIEALSQWRERRSAKGSAEAGAAGPASRSGSTPDANAKARAHTQTDRGSLWLYVSTIGELNAIEPFLKRLLRQLQQPALTLISDRSTYDGAYRARYPQAALERLDGSQAAVRSLLQRRPPLLLLVAEIPCRLHDAPCRFSYATLQAARDAGAPTLLVNGWLYGYPPPSRLDAIEHRLFARDYVQGFDLMLVQTDDVRQRLVAAGADPGRVVVTGNIKFDALRATSVPQGDLADALRARGAPGKDSPAPVIVAGSVTETVDQQAILAAFRQVVATHPQALLVLAPRHPENAPRMAALKTMLDASGLAWRLRSGRPDARDAVACSVLVLDTMGELRGCYAGATIAFVGTDHNVLEPMSFGKPVFVFGGWEPTYPSYPVFAQLRSTPALQVVEDPAELGWRWSKWLDASADATLEDATRATLAAAQGATERCLRAIEERLPALAATAARDWAGAGAER